MMQPGQTIASLFSIIPKEFQHSKNDAHLGWAGLGWPGLVWAGCSNYDAIKPIYCITFSKQVQTCSKNDAFKSNYCITFLKTSSNLFKE
jgi:hypothetical protein